jgi:hypothetical protein
MKRILRKRPSPAMIVAVVAMVMAFGGTAYAKIVITGKNVRNSSLVGADIKNKSLGGKDVKNDYLGRVPIKEERLDASKFGQVNSAKVADGVNRAAAVTATGTKVRSRGVSATARTGEGQYQVTFDRDVRGCYYFATISAPGAAAPGTGQIGVTQLSTNANAVKVITRNSGGTLADRPFHIIASC